MGFLTSLFGGDSAATWWGAAFALIIVLVLIVGGLWLLKLLFSASSSVGRGRQRRLAIIDTLAVDSKRNLVLIRRDKVEHLLVLGGTHDLVVEAGISDEQPAIQPQPGAQIHSGAQPPAAQVSQMRPAERQADTHQANDRRRANSASRLGLTGLLRRYNDADRRPVEPEVDTPVPPAPEPQTATGPLDKLKALGNVEPAAPVQSLRHTGLLRAVSNDDDSRQVAEEDPEISASAGDDSAMNGTDEAEADAEAMASIEEADARDLPGSDADDGGEDGPAAAADDEFADDESDGDSEPDRRR